MLKTTMASVAVLTAVLAMPAQAVPVPAPVTESIISTPWANVAALFGTFSSTWAPYFDPSDYTAIILPNVITAVFSDGVNVRSFTAVSGTAFGSMNGTYQMPVPGPIAGAGLPLIAAGLAFAAWRRRRAANAA